MIWAVLACGELAPAIEAPYALDVHVEELRVDEGPILLHVDAPAAEGWTVEPAISVPEGLEAELVDQSDGTWTFAFSGEPGSYVVPPVVATVTSPTSEVTQIQSENIYVDLAVEGPSSTLESLAVLEPGELPVWPFVLFGSLAVLGLAGGVIWYLRREEPAVDPVVEPGVPPDVEALTAWTKAQEAGLDDHALALEVSRIFRRYVERVSPHPATALTTFELVARLRNDAAFSAFLEPAKGLLQATDRIKFARESGTAEQFAQFGEDLRAIVIATRLAPPESA
ncbi:MAG: hypothetical protein GY913_33295 [Proteobacteria bacterium]|nr:hypothetical protein [Pseudomonadota bacterium]MCP4921802.1 hypothetical protein [Pseudomonadota bacterium]